MNKFSEQEIKTFISNLVPMNKVRGGSIWQTECGRISFIRDRKLWFWHVSKKDDLNTKGLYNYGFKTRKQAVDCVEVFLKATGNFEISFDKLSRGLPIRYYPAGYDQHDYCFIERSCGGWMPVICNKQVAPNSQGYNYNFRYKTLQEAAYAFLDADSVECQHRSF